MKIRLYNINYNAAFQQYLRYDTKISEPFYIFKSESFNDMEFYIWRTQEDNRVRPSHAANNGKVFSYNKIPPTGHPGEDYYCRCYAEEIKCYF